MRQHLVGRRAAGWLCVQAERRGSCRTNQTLLAGGGLNMASEDISRMVAASVQESTSCVCLFCNEGIESGALDPCALHLVARMDRPRHEQKEQTFFCHLRCLQSAAAMHPGNFYIADLDFPTVGEQDAT